MASGIMQLVLAIVVARGLGTAGTGAFFEAVALFTILSNVGELGADTGLVRMLPRYRALGRNQELTSIVRIALAPVFIFCVGLAVATWVWAPSLASLLAQVHHRDDVETYLRALAPFIPLGAASTVALAGTRGMGTMAPFVWIQNVLLPALRPAMVATTLTLGLGSLAVALGWAAPLGLTFVLGTLSLWWLVNRSRRAETVPGQTTRWRAIASEFWRFAGPRALAAVFGVTITWLDILLVGALLHSARQAGIYAAASRLSVVGALALNAVGMAVAPQLSQLASLRQMRDAESVFQVGTWWLMAITWPAYISLAVFAPFLLQVFGHGFVAGQTALVILCLAQLFNLGTGNVTVVLLMVGKSSWNLINAASSLALNIVLNLLLIPRLGITGAAVAWAVAIICNNLAALLEVAFLVKMRPFGSGYWVVTVSSVVCFGGVGTVVRLLVGVDATGFALFAVLATIPYAAVLWWARKTLHLGSLLGERRPVSLAAVPVLACLAALGFVAYYFIAGSHHVPTAPAGKTSRAVANQYAHKVVIHLAATQDGQVKFTTPAGSLLFQSNYAAGTSKTWTFFRAVIITLDNRSGVKLTVDGKNALPPSPATGPATLSLGLNRAITVYAPEGSGVVAQDLRPVSATGLGATGKDQGNNSQLAPRAIDGSSSTAWKTDWYTTAQFGGLVPGTGLLIDMGQPVTITAARITLGGAAGADFQLRVGNEPAMAGLQPVASASDAGGVVRLRLTAPAKYRFVLIWFTRLPPDAAGTFQAAVYNVSLQGPP